MEKEEQLLRKRMIELALQCRQRDIPVFTDFLNLYEQTIFHSEIQSLPGIRYQLVGGYELAERKIVCFLPSYQESYQDVGLDSPVSCLFIRPIHEKFSESLNHRDFLGAVLNLGIERSKIGDIIVAEAGGYVLCKNEMASFIKQELGAIRRTNVEVELVPACDSFLMPVRKDFEGSVASMRLDAILAMAYQTSRTKITPYVIGEKVFVNGKLIASNSHLLKDGDIVSVRGLGKFLFCGVKNQTKKGRFFVTIQKYC